MEQIPLKWDGKQCGVYCIKNRVSGKIYIGSSKNCYHRVRSQHFDRLQRGTHSNPHLQSSWNKYGKTKFDSFCVEICSSENLCKCEQKWFVTTRCLDRRYGYNINPHADRIELTEDQCKRLSLSKFGKSYRKGVPSGIYKQKNGSWCATLCFRRKVFYLGFFPNKKTAISVRKYALPRIVNKQELDWEWIKSLRTKNRNKPVVQMDGEKEVARYVSASDAARHGFALTSVSMCCHGHRKMCGGFTWRFVSD